MRTDPRTLPALLGSILDPSVREIFSPEFIICSELFDLFTVHKVVEVLRQLELSELARHGATAEQIVAAKGFVPGAVIPLRWMLDKLRVEGFLDGGQPLPEADPERFESEACAVDPGCRPSFAVVNEMAVHALEFFRGERTGEEILFAPNRLSLWFDYFNNDNLLYAVNNLLGAEAVCRAFPPGEATLLELGGGSGSAALALAEKLRSHGALGRLRSYRFTEIVPTFLRRAERMIKAAFPELPVAYQKADIDQPLTSQEIEAGSMDLVYAVNTIHIADDLAATLTYIREILKPGGRAVFSECVRPFAGQPIYVEFVFNFLVHFTGVKTDPRIRPNHGFLTPANWRDAFAEAGFEQIAILPNVEEMAKVYPSFFVAAVSGRKP